MIQSDDSMTGRRSDYEALRPLVLSFARGIYLTYSVRTDVYGRLVGRQKSR